MEKMKEEKSELAKTDIKKVSLGLALGGGAMRGIAHVGILKALEDHDLKPDLLTGTSMGAFVAGLYAFGKTPEEIRDMVKELDLFDVSRFTMSRFGLLSNEEIGKIFQKHIGDAKIEDSPMPLAIIAADISTGEKVIIKSGKVSQAIMASACVPGLFIPVQMENRILVDGGIVENIPVSTLKEMGAHLVVGVNLNNARRYKRPEDIVDVFFNAFEIAIDTTTRIQTDEDADVMIKLDVADYSRTESNNVWELYAEGYRGGILSIKEIKNELKKKRPSSLAILEQKFRKWRESGE